MFWELAFPGLFKQDANLSLFFAVYLTGINFERLHEICTHYLLLPLFVDKANPPNLSQQHVLRAQTAALHVTCAAKMTNKANGANGPNGANGANGAITANAANEAKWADGTSGANWVNGANVANEANRTTEANGANNANGAKRGRTRRAR